MVALMTFVQRAPPRLYQRTATGLAASAAVAAQLSQVAKTRQKLKYGKNLENGIFILKHVTVYGQFYAFGTIVQI